jgi:peptidoglycan/LPS O-acetylase OafA/YrhL
VTTVQTPDLSRNNFDLLRFSLAGLVIFSHSFALLSGSNATDPLHRLTRGQITFGELAVDGFFILSGFLVTHSWTKSPALGGFLLKRATRIYPGFIVVTILSVLLLFPLAYRISFGTVPEGGLWRQAVSLVTLRAAEPPGAFPQNAVHAVNGSLWSIPFEAWCYVGTAVCGLAGALRYRKVMLALLVGSTLVSLAFVVWNLNPGGKILGVIFGWPRLWARMLPYFLSGMVFYIYRDRIRYTSLWASGALLALVLASIIPNGWTIAGPWCGAYLLFWLAFNRSIPLNGWARYGDFSYGIYLYAFPLQQLIIQELRPSHPLVLFSISLPASVVLGAASWHGVEKWFIRRHRRIGTAPDENRVPIAVPDPGAGSS